MKSNARIRSRELAHRGRSYLFRAAGGLTLVVLHELDALARTASAIQERISVARRAQGVGELLRDQVDLLPETRARLALDMRERRALLHSWLADLRGGLDAAA